MDAILRVHPKLMEMQGNRIFKSIRIAKTTDDIKAKVFFLIGHKK